MTGYFNNTDSEITLNITYEEVRVLLLETLKGASQGVVDSSYSHIAKLAIDKNIAADPYPTSYYGIENQYLSKQYSLSRNYQIIIRDIFWDLVIEGIVRPGNSNTQQGFPGYHITEKGKAVLNSSNS